MTEAYMRDILRIATSQVLQTIGYNSTQAGPLEQLQDTLHKFLQEFARDLRRQTEHCNRIEANLDDTFLTLDNLNITASELLDYINNVEPVPFAHDIPKFPVHKNSSMNFLKPGSKEVLTRPVHIYEHLPPMLAPEPSSPSSVSQAQSPLNGSSGSRTQVVPSKRSMSVGSDDEGAASSKQTQGGFVLPKRSSEKEGAPLYLKSLPGTSHYVDEEGRPTREISSVVMTTGGYISPAVEGKLPDALIPDIVEKLQGLDAPPPPVSRPTSRASIDNAFSPLESATNTKEQPGKSVDSSAKRNPSGETLSVSVGFASRRNSAETSNQTAAQKAASLHAAALQTPLIASKLLKKAKKKNPSAVQNKSERSEHPRSKVIPSADATDKAQRKKLKMLQKLTKSSKSGNIGDLVGPDGKLKDYINPSVVTSMAPGPERTQLEKLIKKQTKQKQKLLKQQRAAANHKKSAAAEPPVIPVKESLDEKPSLLENDPQPQPMTDTKPLPVLKKEPELTLPLIQQAAPQPPNVYESTNIKPAWSASGLSSEMSLLSSDSNDTKASTEVKLSTEPDRNKLNIFKKISKPKGTKHTSPPVCRTTSYFTSNDSPVINLPSGTTISPAPPTVGRHPYTPEPVRHDKNLNALTVESSNFPLCGAFPEASEPLINKPKKRGRKPGSKNHAKLSTGLNLTAPSSKKSKKLKADKNIFGPSMTVEPLNLTNNNNTEMLGGFPINLPKTFPINNQSLFAPPVKERKERKYKKKSIPAPFPLGDPNAAIGLNGPTKEDINSINKKLLKMDTILNPAPPLAELSIVPTDFTKPSMLPSPNKLPKAPPAKKRSQQKMNASLMPSNIAPPFMPTVGPGFTNLPNNMLSMLPMYPFAPRPGLIPTPGLFPTPGLGGFLNNSGNSSNLLLPGFLPFPNLKPKAQDIKDDIDHLPPMPPPGDRSYCNVAPLVPESMNLSTQGNYDRDFSKSSKTRQPLPATESKAKAAATATKFELALSPDFHSSNNNKSAPTTPGSSFAFGSMEHMRKSTNRAPSPGAASLEPMPPPSSDRKSMANHIFGQGLMLNKSTPALGMDSPIEVSDDSDETQSKIFTAPLPKSKNSNKPAALMQDIFGNINMEVVEPDTTNKDAKKAKKLNKNMKKNSFLSGGPSSNVPLDLFSPDKPGVSKLAGGADLIPLSGTGMAYSSKSIPFTSLTSNPTPVFPMLTKEFEPPKVFDNLTITPTGSNSSVESHRKRKEHKKLKKIKEGKIKKKKDKKDKTKNKERAEKYLKAEKQVKEKGAEKHKDKRQLKKLKKEKKREKQRMSMESADGSPNSQDASDEAHSEKLADSPALGGPSTSAGVVPKLTLKLAEREKKEPSPELARISPLVTRPPKQKPASEGASLASQSASPCGSNSSSNDSLNETGKNIAAAATAAVSTPLAPPPSPWLPGATLAASAVLLPQQLLQTSKQHEHTSRSSTSHSTESNAGSGSASAEAQQNPAPVAAEANRPSSYIDPEGNQVWICPACGKVDDGSPMIGCDSCDAWYHWVCVGIVVEPKENENWYCRVCITRKKANTGVEKKRKRNKKR